MNTVSRWSKRVLGVLFTLFIFFLFSQLFTGCFQFRMDDDEAGQYFKDLGINVDFESYLIDENNVFFASTGNDTSQIVLFIHGTPGAWTNFIDFLGNPDLIRKYRLVAVDRPGFGNSDFGHSEASLEDQSRLLKPILKKNRSHRLPILVGHSIGGPIAAKMLMMYPDLIDAAILVAPSIDPDLEPKEPWRKLLRLPVIRNMIPTAIRVSNEEIINLKPQLVQMLPQWENIEKQVIVIQGGDDFLVDPATAEFSEKVLVNSPHEVLFYEEADHFIPWTAPELINRALLNIDE